jgi:hypothetical protein
MLQRLSIVAAALMLCMAFGIQETSAAGQVRSQISPGTHFNGNRHGGIAHSGSKGWRAHRARQIGSVSWGWSFYDDPFYYADPVYFSQCYQRIRIETLYGVMWRPVRVCNR